MGKKLKVLLLDEAEHFMSLIDQKAQLKIIRNIDRIEEGLIDVRIFKKLEGSEIWEFRAEYESNAYRLLAFWDKRKRALIIATHGFVKKTQKTPAKEISKAEKIRLEYLKNRAHENIHHR